MSKSPEHRKFGLMGCDHCFCLGCIRNWRSQSGADLDTVRLHSGVHGLLATVVLYLVQS